MPGYKWIQQDCLFYEGEPSRRLLDRTDGYQVLFLINYCASLIEGFTPEAGRLMEEKIHAEMPSDMKSERSAFNWLVKQRYDVE